MVQLFAGLVKKIQAIKGLSLFQTEKLVDSIKWEPVWSIRRFEDHMAHRFDFPYNVTVFPHNLLLNEGINELWTLVCGNGATKFDSGNAYLGVGNSSTAAAAGQTDLQGGSKLYNPMDSGYPTFGTNQQATWKSTFASGDAIFSWQEFTVCNTSSGTGKNLNRKTSDQGTKTSGQVWELTLSITLS